MPCVHISFCTIDQEIIVQCVCNYNSIERLRADDRECHRMTKGTLWSSPLSFPCCLVCTASRQHDKHFLKSSCLVSAALVETDLCDLSLREKREIYRGKAHVKGACLGQASYSVPQVVSSTSKSAQWSDLCIMTTVQWKHLLKHWCLHLWLQNSKCTVCKREWNIHPILFLIHQPCSESS